MPTVLANNITIYYEQHGQGDDLVLISGLSADHNAWLLMRQELAKHYRITIFDNRGAGQTSAPDVPYTSKMMADDTAALMDALAITQAYVVGHSLGGHITQQLAIHYPQKLHKAVIACSRAIPSPASTMFLNNVHKLIQAGIKRQLLIENTIPYIFGSSYIGDEIKIQNYIKAAVNNPNPQTLHGHRHQISAATTHNTTTLLATIKASTLVIDCDDDALTPIRNAIFIAEKIPGAKLEIVQDCGHMLPIEKPLLFNKLITDFCQ